MVTKGRDKKRGKSKTPSPAATIPETGNDGFPIVGIGASAGGLAAFEAFFAGLPAIDPGMAFILVQHLAPDHKSILSELIRRYTRMAVHQVEGLDANVKFLQVKPRMRRFACGSQAVPPVRRPTP